MTIVLRVGGSEPAIDKLLSQLPQGRIDASWKAGETRGRGVRERPGFNMLLSDVDDAAAALSAAARGLQRISKFMSEAGGEIDAEIDIALYVYAGRMASVVLPPSFLSAAADAGLAIQVSAYPCSDDDDDNDAK